MSDIVERLRAQPDCSIRREAADEITRLRSLLRLAYGGLEAARYGEASLARLIVLRYKIEDELGLPRSGPR